MSFKINKLCFLSVLFVSCLAWALVAPAAFPAAETYVFKTLTPPGATQSEAAGINNRGDIVGDFTDDSGTHGFLLTADGYTTLDYPGADATRARGINEKGDIVGEYDIQGSTHGFLMVRRGKALVFTPIDFPGALNTYCEGINARGTIVGGYDDLYGGIYGFIYEKGSFSALDVPGSDNWTSAYGINNKDVIVGGYALVEEEYYFHGFSFYKGKFDLVSDPDYVDLVCFGINERDDIVGWHGYDGETSVHGFLLRKGVFLNLDVPDAKSTEAFGINARGDIVGLYIDQKQVQHGFLATAK